MKDSKRDKRWSDAVGKKYNFKCVHCGKDGCAHHIIPRSVKSTRYILENGIWVCNDLHRIFELSLNNCRRIKCEEMYVGKERIERLILVKYGFYSCDFFDFSIIQ